MVDFLVSPSSSVNKNSSKPEVKAKAEIKSEVKPKVETKLSNWDTNIAPVLDNHPEWKDVVNYNTAKHIMRAYNGRYDKAMWQLKQDDPKAYETMKKFKNNAFAMANELKKIDTGGFNPELFKKYSQNADAYFDIAADTFKESKKKAFIMNDKAELMTPRQFEKYNQDPSVSRKYSQSAKVFYTDKEDGEIAADYENVNVTKAYTKLKNVDEQWRINGINKIAPITNSWVATALERLGEPGTKSDTNSAAFYMSTDIIYHVGKYKTTQDPDLATADQRAAIKIAKQLKGKTPEEKRKVIKDNAEIIKGMTKRMGYYGNAKIFNQYKNSTIGKNLDFYPASNKSSGKSQMDYFNMAQENGAIDMHIKNYRQFRDADQGIKEYTKGLTKDKWKEITDGLGYDMSKKQFETALDQLVDNKGNFMSYQTWKKNLSRIDDPDNHADVPLFGSAFANRKMMSAKDQIYEQNSDYVTLGEYVHPAHWIWGKNNAERKEDQLKKIYNDLKKGYKRTFDDAKAKQKYASSLFDLNWGDERNQALEFRGINLNVNKDMRLKEGSGPKQENANKIFSLMFDDNGNVDTENVTIFGTKDIKAGLNALDKEELEEQKKSNETVLKEFLKDNNEHVTMTFFKNTNVPGQAAYQFYNPDTKKSIMVYTPYSAIGKNGVKEDIYMNTHRSPLDFTFKLKGELAMPILNNDDDNPAYKKATLKYDKKNDQYYGETIHWNSEGNSAIHRYVIPAGSQISVDAAQKSYMRFLNDIRND